MKKISFSKMIFGVLVAMFMVPTCVMAATDVNSEALLEQALADGETVINLTDDITLTEDEGTSVKRTVGLEVKGEGVITINGNGHKITTDLIVAMEVRANTGKTLKLVLNDITVIGAERAVDTRSEGITLELDKTNLNVTKSGNYQALTIGGSAGPINVTIKNKSVLDGGKYGYGIITFNPVNMTIEDSTVKGYAALYLKSADGSQGSAGSVITVKKSILEGNSSSNTEGDNDFGTIVFEDSNIKVNIIDSVVKATNTGTAIQSPISTGSDWNPSSDINNSVTFSGKSEIIVDTVTESPMYGTEETGQLDVVVKPGVKSTINIKEEYLEEGTEVVVDEQTGEVTVVVKTPVEPENNDKNPNKDDSKNDVKNPDTGDNILSTFILFGLSLVSITAFAIYNKKCYR